MPSHLPTAPNERVGFQPPPTRSAPISRMPRKDFRPSIPFTPGDETINYDPILLVLIGYLQQVSPKGLDDAVASAYTQIPGFMDKLKINDAATFLRFANDLLRWIPHETHEGKDVVEILCMFYFVFDQSPLVELQTQIVPESVGQPLTWLSSWIVVYAQLVGSWMDTPGSLTPQSLQSFVNSPIYNVGEALVPPGGWRTFNEFFSRRLQLGARPVAEPDNDKVIVYPADCKYDDSLDNQSIVNISSEGTVLIKGLPWTISSLLQGSEYANEFNGGVWMHAFLSAYNYHRQHAPVAGTVLEAKVIQGTAYLEVNPDGSPQRMIVPDAPDNPGYQFLQTRGLIIIDNPLVGKVAVLPIGMAQVSSVKLAVREGDVLKKGQEISHFEFGGSDIICVFQSAANLSPSDFVASGKGDNDYSKTGTVLAVALTKNIG
ncbi:phosphatidylserine decarboxylase-domain-containing protein [Hypoxylon cercidicola]|nr:phosphatidylserine decarboxylase-domain-containing protein [Hypoxylon cercidicola]